MLKLGAIVEIEVENPVTEGMSVPVIEDEKIMGYGTAIGDGDEVVQVVVYELVNHTSVLQIGGKEFNISKISPKQLVGIAKFFASMTTQGKKKLKDMKLDDTTSILWGVLDVITEDELINFASLLIGCDKEFARENFDLEWMSEAFAILAEKTNVAKVIENFTRAFSGIS